MSLCAKSDKDRYFYKFHMEWDGIGLPCAGRREGEVGKMGRGR